MQKIWTLYAFCFITLQLGAFALTSLFGHFGKRIVRKSDSPLLYFNGMFCQHPHIKIISRFNNLLVWSGIYPSLFFMGPHLLLCHSFLTRGWGAQSIQSLKITIDFKRFIDLLWKLLNFHLLLLNYLA